MKKLWVLLLLAGCASLEDFQSMSADERADFVCDQHRDIEALDSQIIQVGAQISDTERAISLGYRLHRSCKWVPTVVSTEERCTTSTSASGKETRVCKEESKLSNVEVCDEIPVSIDGDLERRKLADDEQHLRELERRVDDAFNTCHHKVNVMSAARAFEYYQSVKGSIF